MTRKTLIILAAAGSLVMLLGAFGFQYIGGMAPCHLCLLQRWPHAAAILIGIIAAIFSRNRILPYFGAAAALTTSGIGFYHTGIERHWWQGPTTCTSGSVEGIATSDLLDQILAAPVVHCDQVAWEMFTLSMASWNMLASLALAMVWLAAARRQA